MSDGKVMQKYYPADFDPSKLLPPRALRQKYTAGPKQMNIRMMLPFTMRCSSCNEYLYIATKFNSKCQKLKDATTLGLAMYRFTGKCKHCAGEFSFRTDPEHSDYVLESGGVRSYEAFKDADYAEAEVAKRKAEEEAEDESQALENKIYDTAAEMRRLEELGELRSLNKREARRHDTIHLAIEKVTREAFQDTGEDDGEEFRQLKRMREEAAEEEEKVEEERKSKKFSQFSVKGIKIRKK
jgi:hypothetical protein